MDAAPLLVCQKILKHVPAYDWFFVARVNKWWSRVTRALFVSDGKHAHFSLPDTYFKSVCGPLPTLWYALAPLREIALPLRSLRILWFGPPPTMTHYELKIVETLCKTLWSLDLSRSTLAEFVPHLLHWCGYWHSSEFIITQTAPATVVSIVANPLDVEADGRSYSFTPTDWNGRFLRWAMTANISLELIRYVVLELMGAANTSMLFWARLMDSTLYFCRLDVAMWLDAEGNANADIDEALCQVAKRVVQSAIYGTPQQPFTRGQIYSDAGETATERHRAIRSLLCRRSGLFQLIQRDEATLIHWTRHCVDLDIAPSPAHRTRVQHLLRREMPYRNMMTRSHIFAFMVDRVCARPLVSDSLPWLSLLVQTHQADRQVCAEFIADMYISSIRPMMPRSSMLHAIFDAHKTNIPIIVGHWLGDTKAPTVSRLLTAFVRQGPLQSFSFRVWVRHMCGAMGHTTPDIYTGTNSAWRSVFDVPWENLTPLGQAP
jgi:hypothetical protein